MARKMGKEETSLLTEVELELMDILWRLGEGTVNDVLNNLNPDRKLAYFLHDLERGKTHSQGAPKSIRELILGPKKTRQLLPLRQGL